MFALIVFSMEFDLFISRNHKKLIAKFTVRQLRCRIKH
uniref:Uncharacterized protein n=1 Tax=Ciona intestinalis TaxID=7719 RepID=H2XP39_CIOIN